MAVDSDMRANKIAALRPGKGVREFLGLFPCSKGFEGACRCPGCGGPAVANAAVIHSGDLIVFAVCRGHVSTVAENVETKPTFKRKSRAKPRPVQAAMPT